MTSIRTHVRSILVVAGVVAGLATTGRTTLAQSGTNPATTDPHAAATEPKADQPLTAVVGEPDAQLLRVLNDLTGRFEAPPDADRPALILSSSQINVPTLPGAVYFEISRADNPAEPFRSGVFWAYRRQGEMRLRVFDFNSSGNAFTECYAGLCNAPDTFPAIDVSSLNSNVDLPLAESGGVCSGETPAPLPTMRDGAIEITSRVKISPTALTFDDRGYNAQGKQVWGSTSGAGITFSRVDTRPVNVNHVDEGLTIIIVVPPKPGEPKLVEGGEVTVHYTGWLTNGTKFDSSRQAGREPFRVRIPGGVIKGWNLGLKDIAKGERRRLVIPPALAYGERGAGRGLIPPNSTLIFDIECLHVDNSNPTPPPPPPQPPAPAANPAGKPADASTPIGKPASGAQPEQPRR